MADLSSALGMIGMLGAPETGGASLALEGLGTGATAATDGLSQATGQLSDFSSSAKNATSGLDAFVNALNPGLITQVNKAWADLSATVGVALEPAFDELLSGIQNISGELLPFMQELAPMVGQVTGALFRLLGPLMQLAGAIAEGFMPYVQMAADYLSYFMDSLRPTVALFTALAKFSNQFSILPMIASGFKELLSMVQKVTNAMLQFVVYMARSIGANQFADDFIKGLSSDKKGGATSVGNVAMSNIGSIQNDMLKNAYMASGEQQADPMAEIIEQLKQIKGNQTIIEIRDKIERMIGVATDILNKIPGVSGAVQTVKDTVRNNWEYAIPVYGPGKAIYDGAGWLKNKLF